MWVGFPGSPVISWILTLGNWLCGVLHVFPTRVSAFPKKPPIVWLTTVHCLHGVYTVCVHGDLYMPLFYVLGSDKQQIGRHSGLGICMFASRLWGWGFFLSFGGFPKLCVCMQLWPVMNWHAIQVVPFLVPRATWGRLQAPCNPAG